MNEFNPKVSIIIPVYNGANYLSEAIDSALAQSYENVEVIVVNDGSNDDGATEQIIYSYGDKINYLNKENGGVASALNLGLRKMAGEYFSWLSHDDVYYPDKITSQVEWLRQNDGQRNVVLYSDFDLIDSASKVIGTSRIRHLEPEDFTRNLITEHSVNGCTILVPKACLDKTGLFDESLRTTQDYDLWFRMSCDFDFVHLPVALIKSRIHCQQGSVSMSSLMHREQHEFFITFLSKIRASKDCVDVSSCLLKTAIHLTRNKFPEAGAYGYAAARSRMVEDGSRTFNCLWLMGYYHLVTLAVRVYGLFQ